MKCLKCNGNMVILSKTDKGTQFKCLSDGFRFYKFNPIKYETIIGVNSRYATMATDPNMFTGSNGSNHYHLTMSKPPNRIQVFFLRLLGFDVEVFND